MNFAKRAWGCEGVRAVAVLGALALGACATRGRAIDAWTTSSPNVARIVKTDEVKLVSVGEESVAGHLWVEVRPGCHTVVVQYDHRVVKDKEQDEEFFKPHETALPTAPETGKRFMDSVAVESSDVETENGTVTKNRTLNLVRHYKLKAWFAVNFVASHVYEVTDTFTGDDIIPRLVEKNAAGEHVAEHAATDEAHATTCVATIAAN